MTARDGADGAILGKTGIAEVRTVPRYFWSFTMLMALVLAGCNPGPTTTNPSRSETAPAAAPAAPTRAMVMAVRYEVVGLASKRLEAAASDWTKRPFNASLAVVDGQGARQPYLAESLPRLEPDA